MQETINWLMGMPTEILISYMKYRFNDTDLYPNWEWEVDEKKNPKKDKVLKSEERIKLLDELLDHYGYYWFYGRSKPKEEIEKILNNKKFKSNQIAPNTLIQEESLKDNSLAIEEENQIEEFKNNSTISITDELEKLSLLKEKGLLTEEEFIAAKAKLLK